jgi:hypothetical protein
LTFERADGIGGKVIREIEARKRDAILAYESQFVKPEKNREVVKWVDAANVYFGSRIGTAGAEAFFTKEPVGLNSLDGLT